MSTISVIINCVHIWIFVKYPAIQGEVYTVTGSEDGCESGLINYGTTTDITKFVTDQSKCIKVKCVPCSKGYYRAADAPKSTCLKCPAGTTADTAGKEKCDDCPVVRL